MPMRSDPSPRKTAISLHPDCAGVCGPKEGLVTDVSTHVPINGSLLEGVFELLMNVSV
jgi:hypothetical protein